MKDAPKEIYISYFTANGLVGLMGKGGTKYIRADEEIRNCPHCLLPQEVQRKGESSMTKIIENLPLDECPQVIIAKAPSGGYFICGLDAGSRIEYSARLRLGATTTDTAAFKVAAEFMDEMSSEAEK